MSSGFSMRPANYLYSITYDGTARVDAAIVPQVVRVSGYSHTMISSCCAAAN
jgi:hypothetical protein